MVFLLITVCILIPFRLAFDESNNPNWGWESIYALFDFFFFIDIIVTFFTVYEDKEKMVEVVDKKEIASNYIYSWFLLDFLSIVPIDMLISLTRKTAANRTSNGNMMVRMVRLGKIYKLLRLMRLVKVFKILKNKENLAAHFEEKLKMSAGTERLLICAVGFLFFTHIFGCFFVIIGSSFADSDRNSWFNDE